MERSSFVEILMDNSPEQLNDFLLKKGKVKLMNCVTFLDNMEMNKIYPKDYIKDKHK